MQLTMVCTPTSVYNVNDVVQVLEIKVHVTSQKHWQYCNNNPRTFYLFSVVSYLSDTWVLLFANGFNTEE